MRIVKNILNTLLSLTILVSTVGIPVNRHYCLDRLIDVRLFTEAVPCAMETAITPEACETSHDQCNDKPVKRSCHDTHDLVKLNNLQNSFFHIELAKLYPVSVIAFIPYQPEFNIDPYTSALILSHSPPLIEPDKTVKFHSFLI